MLHAKLGVAESRFLTGKQLEAIKEVQLLEKDAVQRKDTAQLLRILILGGNFFIKRDQHEESRKVFERGLKYAVKFGDQQHIIRFRQGLATSLFGLNQFPGAIKEFKKVLSEAQILNDSDVLAVTYQNVALVYYHKQDFETCIDYQRHALTYNRKGIKSDSYAEMLNNLGAYFSAANRVDSALQCYFASESIHRILKNPQGVIRSKFNQANIKLKQKKLAEAEKEFINLNTEVKKYDITVGEFYVLNSLAEVKELQGKYSIALVLYDSTLNHLLKNNMKYLGTQTLSSRLNLIKQKMKLDTNHIAFKNQRSYEAQFAVATDDTVLSQFKKETYPTKSKIKSVSENQKSSYDWVYYLTGLSALIITLVLVRKRHKKQPINIQKFLEENPKFIHFQTSMNQMLDEEFLWKDPDCPPH